MSLSACAFWQSRLPSFCLVPFSGSSSQPYSHRTSFLDISTDHHFHHDHLQLQAAFLSFITCTFIFLASKYSVYSYLGFHRGLDRKLGQNGQHPDPEAANHYHDSDYTAAKPGDCADDCARRSIFTRVQLPEVRADILQLSTISYLR